MYTKKEYILAKQVKSKSRVANFGEVFTAQREIDAMLDLVKSETERIDSRFLEPACGDGNFLASILERKLKVVKKKYSKFPGDYEKYSLLAITSIYGVDILIDNVTACIERLYKIWLKDYKKVCKKECNEDTGKSIKYILSRNILCGNALSMMRVDESGKDTETPIIFPEWAFISGSLLKRKDYRFDVLLQENSDESHYSQQLNLFEDSPLSLDCLMIDETTNEHVPKPVKEYKAVHYRRIWENE